MLNLDFKELLQLFNANGVRYLVVGGYAVAFHGHPRYTKDLDVWIEISPENAANVMKALQQFGFGAVGLQIEDFLKPTQITQLGYPPGRVDILGELAAVDFPHCYAARLEIRVDDVTVCVIGADDLIKNKLASGRHQDLADVEKLGGSPEKKRKKKKS